MLRILADSVVFTGQRVIPLGVLDFPPPPPPGAHPPLMDTEQAD